MSTLMLTSHPTFACYSDLKVHEVKRTNCYFTNWIYKGDLVEKHCFYDIGLKKEVVV